jgi:hypothetical protein
MATTSHENDFDRVKQWSEEFPATSEAGTGGGRRDRGSPFRRGDQVVSAPAGLTANHAHHATGRKNARHGHVIWLPLRGVVLCDRRAHCPSCSSP